MAKVKAGGDVPLTTTEGAVIGAVTGFSVASREGKHSLDLSGVVFGVEEFGWADARFTASIPIAPGWTLTKVPERPATGT